MSAQNSNYPKLHNAMWPGLVGKGSPGAEPPIDLDTMLELTAQAQVDGIRFDGVDLFLADPHVSIDSDEDALKGLADKVASKGFVVGSVVAPVWAPTGGGSAMGSDEERGRFVEQVRKACHIGKVLRDLGIRPYGVVRIDSASSVTDWAADPEGNQEKIAQTFNQACDVAESFGERLAAEGEICWGGMHSWKKMLNLLERVNRPGTLGFQADMAHTLLYILGYNEPDDAILPADWDWSDPHRLDGALHTLTEALRPWTIDFHVAQNDATVHGSGTHDKTGHHCLATDPNGKLDIARHAGFWLRGEDGQPTRAFQHICWDGCMFPNEVMMKPETWNGILQSMIAVRDAHGWIEEAAPVEAMATATVDIQAEVVAEPAPAAAVRPKPIRAPKAPRTKPAKHIAARPAKPAAKRPAKRAPKRAAKKPAAKAAKRRAPKATHRKPAAKARAHRHKVAHKGKSKVARRNKSKAVHKRTGRVKRHTAKKAPRRRK
jgi:xylose isomerase-like TIM barrel protein